MNVVFSTIGGSSEYEDGKKTGGNLKISRIENKSEINLPLQWE